MSLVSKPYYSIEPVGIPTPLSYKISTKFVMMLQNYYVIIAEFLRVTLNELYAWNAINFLSSSG